jgi:hypothetical protein
LPSKSVNIVAGIDERLLRHAAVLSVPLNHTSPKLKSVPIQEDPRASVCEPAKHSIWQRQGIARSSSHNAPDDCLFILYSDYRPLRLDYRLRPNRFYDQITETIYSM